MDIVFNIAEMLISTVSLLLIVWFIVGLLFAFNVINRSNHFMVELDNSLRRLFEPVLAPIRRILPDTGMMDFSPLVLIMIINALRMILEGLRPY